MSAESARATAPVVVITGGSAGVGRAAAEAFARDGWDVALLARGEDRLSDTAAAIEAEGRRALPIVCDVADADAVIAAADRIEREFGAIDCWVNDAMATEFAAVADMSPADFRRVVDVTLLGQVHGTMAALRHMRRRDRGTIVHVGSALAYRSIPLQSAYCAAKHGLRGFVDSLRAELIHENSGIRLTVVHLPGLNTPQFDWARNRMEKEPRPVPPVYQPEAAARAILKAAREAPRELWVGRATVKLILGNMLAPAWLDRLLSRKAIGGQMSDRPAQDRPDNLHAPAPGPYASHGRYESMAEDSAWTLDPDKGRVALGLALGAAALGALAWCTGRRHGAPSRRLAGRHRRRGGW